MMLLIILGVLVCAGLPSRVLANAFTDLGPTSSPGSVVCLTEDDCNGILYCNHDYTFENGYAWRYGGIQPPYYGAFGEAYHRDWQWDGFRDGPIQQNIAPDPFECIVLWLTDVGYYMSQTCDLYVWDGGVTGEPENVLFVSTGVDPGQPAIWPDVSEHRIYVGFWYEGNEFTVGYWGNWPGVVNGFFVGADLDGFGGNPWTCLAPGSGYGTGWHDPSVVWGPTESLGIGYTQYPYTSPKSATWGKVKTLFGP